MAEIIYYEALGQKCVVWPLSIPPDGRLIISLDQGSDSVIL